MGEYDRCSALADYFYIISIMNIHDNSLKMMSSQTIGPKAFCRSTIKNILTRVYLRTASDYTLLLQNHRYFYILATREHIFTAYP